MPAVTLVFRGRLWFDEFATQIQDKSLINGHYYSDKAPLATLILVPALAGLRAIGLVSEELPIYRQLNAALGVGGFLCGSLPFLYFLCTCLRECRLRSGRSTIVLTCLALYGSFLFVFSGVFFAHLLAGALLLLADRAARARLSIRSGIWLGLAFLAEYPTILALPIWVGGEFWSRRIRSGLHILAGFAPGLLVALAYNHLVTGNALRFPYQFVSDPAFAEMSKGFGLRLPTLEAIYGLLISPYRGLFFFAPALCVVALSRVWRLPKTGVPCNTAAVRILAFFAVSVAFFSSYYAWWGGWSYGPRHLIPAAMLLFAEGLPLLSTDKRGWILAGVCASIFGLFCSLLAKFTVGVLVQDQFENPVLQFIWPKFAEGKLNPYNLLSLLTNSTAHIADILWFALFGLSLVAFSLLSKTSAASTSS